MNRWPTLEKLKPQVRTVGGEYEQLVGGQDDEKGWLVFVASKKYFNG